jgi:hypothetical protein
MIKAVKGNYPQWMITPDDPVSPFGQYEETVRKVYEKRGRYWGDVYWLGFRNVLFGLAYEWKPAWLKRMKSYEDMPTEKTTFLMVTTVKLFDLREYTINLGLFSLILGNKLSPIHNGKKDPVRAINMDGRPVFSIRINNGDK